MSIRIVTVLMLAMMFAVCTVNAVAAGDVAATVNGCTITADEVKDLMYSWYAPMALEEIIITRLAGDEAEKAGIVVTDAEIESKLMEIEAKAAQHGMVFKDYIARQGRTPAYVKAMVLMQLQAEKVIKAGITVTPEDFAGYRKASHILVLTRNVAMQPGDKPKDANAIDAEAKAKIEKIAQEIKDGLPFEEAAKKYSDDRSNKNKGGSLGWFKKDGRFVSEFENAAFNLKSGEISEPVKTKFGYHIIRIDAVGSEVTGDAKKELEEIIIQSQVNINEWLMHLRQQAQVESDLITKPKPPAQPTAENDDAPPPPPTPDN